MESRKLSGKQFLLHKSEDEILNDFFSFASAGKKKEIEKSLSQIHDVNCTDKSGNTALHIAVKYGHVDVVKLLIKYRVDVNFRQKKPISEEAKGTIDNTALHIAAYFDQVECAKILLKNYADIEARNSNHRTPLYIATALKKNKVAKLLLDHEADLKANDDYVGCTLLHTAAQWNNLELIKLFIKKGISVDRTFSPQSDTPLHLAVKEGHVDAVEVLLKEGATTTIQNAKGEIPMHIAMQQQNLAIVKLLYKSNKSQLIIADGKNKSPLDYTDYQSMAELFECGFNSQQQPFRSRRP